jgi:valyl-tRNA synthetase
MNKNKYTIMLPPPNVSGSLHIGHALNFFLQDFLISTRKILFPENTIYMLPGLDHGSTATQYGALKNVKDLDKLNNEEKYNIIYNFADGAMKNILYQMDNFHLNTNKEYLKYTMSEEHTKLVNKSFVTLYNKGLIYEDERIIYWDKHLNTALSNLEVVHKKVTDKLFYIKYKLKSHEDNEYMIVATTRPETMFGDVALAVGEAYKAYEGSYGYIPLINKEIPIIFDTYVKDDFGSGVLKVTPGHDENDFNLGKKHKLPIINIYDKNLNLSNEDFIPGELRGLSPLEARKILLELLQKENLLEKEEVISHSIMVGDKSGVPIETIVKKQWYLDLSAAGKKALKALDDGEFKIFPEHQWEGTYRSFLNNLQPWCLSRENLWGHKIPLWRKKNGEIIVAENEELAKKIGGNEEIIQDNFLLDTWFSSGLWPLLYKENKEDLYPSNLLVTGYDIIFFWVARMVMLSLELDNSLPFPNVLIHNLVRDGAGDKMSKTRGNVVDPMDIINKYGNRDVLGYGLLSKITLRGQIRFSEEDLVNGEKLINKLKNSVKFLQINYKEGDFNEINKLESITINNEIVKYFLEEFKKLNPEDLFVNYNVYDYIHNLYDFFWNVYCDWMLEISKKQMENIEIKFMLIYLIKNILKLFYGLMPNITSELYGELFKVNILEDSHKIKMHYNFTPENFNKIENLIYIIKQLRILKSSNILTGSLIAENIHEKLALEGLKISVIEEEEDYKYILIGNRKVFFEEVNEENLQRYYGKKKSELDKLSLLEANNPPEDIMKTIKNNKSIIENELKFLTNLF